MFFVTLNSSLSRGTPDVAFTAAAVPELWNESSVSCVASDTHRFRVGIDYTLSLSF